MVRSLYVEFLEVAVVSGEDFVGASLTSLIDSGRVLGVLACSSIFLG